MDVLGYRQRHYPFDRVLFLPLEQTPEWDFNKQAHYTKSKMFGNQNDKNKEIILFVIHSTPVPLFGIRMAHIFLHQKTTNKKSNGFIGVGKQFFIEQIVNSNKRTEMPSLLGRIKIRTSLGNEDFLQKTCQPGLFQLRVPRLLKPPFVSHPLQLALNQRSLKAFLYEF